MATESVTLNCAHIGQPDLGAIDCMARIQLGLRRRGCDLQLLEPSDELLALVEFAGLGDVLRVEVQRQPEKREKALGVEEERELADPPA